MAGSTLDGTHVVVIGGASGIGLATSSVAASAGARVTLVALHESSVNAAVAGLGESVAGQAVDARDAHALSAFASSVGVVDHLVLSFSGPAGAGPVDQLDMTTITEGWVGKPLAYLRAVQALLPALDPRASITMLAAGKTAQVGPAMLNGSVTSAVAPLARELAPRRVNAVCPGVIDTPRWDRLTPDKHAAFAGLVPSIPLGRVGDAEEVASMIVSLMTNGYVTGQVIAVDGGLTL